MSRNMRRLARLVSMIAFKEALDTQIEILEFEIEQTTNRELTQLLTQELLRVTVENLSASRDILHLARSLNLRVSHV